MYRNSNISKSYAIEPSRLKDAIAVSDSIRTPVSSIVERLKAQQSSADSGTSGRGVRLAGIQPDFITITGVIGAGMMGGTSTDEIHLALDVFEEYGLSRMVLFVDSPGGTTSGIDELAGRIRSIREKGVYIIGYAPSLCCSAAYYLASQASILVTGKDAEVGSIGVIMVHEDYSDYYKKEGIAFTVVSAGRHKADGYDMYPPTDEYMGRKRMMVNAIYEDFIVAVANGRGVDAVKVSKEWANGLVYTAKEALSNGMIDAIMSREEVINLITKTASKEKALSSTSVSRMRTQVSTEESTAPPTTAIPERKVSEWLLLSQSTTKGS